MSNPVFVDIFAKFGERIQGIDGTGDYYNDLSQAVYLTGMQPVPKAEDLPAGAVMVTPGEAQTVDGEGVRLKTVSLEYLVDRPIEVYTVVELADKDNWLPTEEKACKDIRRALFADPHDWLGLYVKHLYQVSQSSERPQAGSNVLHVQQIFTIRHVDK